MKIQLQKGFIEQKTNASLRIFDPENTVLYSFNSTASFIFDRIKKRVGINQLIKEVCEEYSVSETRAKKDLKEFIDSLSSKGIVKIVKNDS